MCHEDNHSESTELPDGTIGKAGDDTQDRVVGTALQGVGGSSPTQTSCDTVLHGQGDRGGIYGIDLNFQSVVRGSQALKTYQGKHVLYPDECDNDGEQFPKIRSMH